MPQGHILTEADWADPDHPHATAYERSKTLAERAAWEFAEAHPDLRLTTINPGLVLGQPLDATTAPRLSVVERIFGGKDPAVPDVGFPVVDLRDVSRMHVAALGKPGTEGRRYVAAAGWVTMPEMARWIAEAYPERKVRTRIAPRWLLTFLSLFDRTIGEVRPNLGRKLSLSNDRARADMKIRFTRPRDSVLPSAAYLAKRRQMKRLAFIAALALAGCADETVSGYAHPGPWRLAELNGRPYSGTATLSLPAPRPGERPAALPRMARAADAPPIPWFILSHLELTPLTCAASKADEPAIHALASVTLAEVQGKVLILSSEDARPHAGLSPALTAPPRQEVDQSTPGGRQGPAQAPPPDGSRGNGRSSAIPPPALRYWPGPDPGGIAATATAGRPSPPPRRAPPPGPFCGET